MAWKLMEGNSLWATFFGAKYLPKFLNRNGEIKLEGSDLWKDIQHLMLPVIRNSRWLIGKENTCFWSQNWTSGGLLLGASFHPLSELEKTAQIKDFWTPSGTWNWELIDNFVTPPVVQAIVNSGISPSHRKDRFIRTLSPSGKVSFRSAWNLTRNHRPKQHWPMWVWNKFVPPKIAIFLWKVMHDVVLVDSVIQRLGISLASRPSRGWLKLNVDRSARGNPGEGGGGGICRDEHGSLIFAFHNKYGLVSNTVAEAQAMVDGIEICKDMELSNIEVETDSRTLHDAASNSLSSDTWNI
ncbi:uncharacterized protein LOC131228085 [Magnolia sinica]|uniref:uncharacterized protein LOC131228085 n=1 Tax=Magnolia sinica TaxID=86752 RepID=UPI0026596635|nr:uncharacterized protein LOC131228085 [Magnolia sinica]